jgi:hypothetical protein
MFIARMKAREEKVEEDIIRLDAEGTKSFDKVSIEMRNMSDIIGIIKTATAEQAIMNKVFTNTVDGMLKKIEWTQDQINEIKIKQAQIDARLQKVERCPACND